MTTAFVGIFGEPLDPGGVPWIARNFLSKERTEARFQVPVNRKFRLSVTGTNGRGLGKIYESTHAPGSAPVAQEFIIVVR